MSTNQSAKEFPLLKIKCPHCAMPSEFWITSQTFHLFKFLGMGIGQSRTLSLACGECGFSEFVQERDFTSWRDLGWKYEEFRDQKLSPEEFSKYVTASKLPELSELLLASLTWDYSCGETNPGNFENCWKCHTPSGRDAVELKSRPVDTGEWQHWKPLSKPGTLVTEEPNQQA
ncbi:MAG: hypothetical protein ABF379_00905 [Akkermansiaceae bacterium]